MYIPRNQITFTDSRYTLCIVMYCVTPQVIMCQKRYCLWNHKCQIVWQSPVSYIRNLVVPIKWNYRHSKACFPLKRLRTQSKSFCMNCANFMPILIRFIIYKPVFLTCLENPAGWQQYRSEWETISVLWWTNYGPQLGF